MDPYSVVAFDPGGDTGWTVFSIYGEAMWDEEYLITANIIHWEAGEFVGSLDDQVDEAVELVNAWEDADIVSEDFILGQFLPGREVLDPVRVNAKLEYAIRPRYVHLQSPALAKTTITDDRLRDMGLWQDERLVGKKDARSAVRHALTFARRRRESNISSRRTGSGRRG